MVRTRAIAGVAGPEAANNAAAAGILVPMPNLGLPTSATAAIMLRAFRSYGINPGPLLFEQQGDWTTFVTRPGRAVILALAVAALLGPRIYGVWARRRAG